jgi:hypothetical protein
MRVNKSKETKRNYVQTKNPKYPIHKNPSRINTDGKPKKVKESNVYETESWLAYEAEFNEKYKEPSTILGKVSNFIDNNSNEIFYIGVFILFSAILISGSI